MSHRGSYHPIVSMNPVEQPSSTLFSPTKAMDTFQKPNEVGASSPPGPGLYVFIFGTWALAILWFSPRLFQLLDMAHSWGSWAAMISFIAFIHLAWLYGFYNIGVVAFALLHRFWGRNPAPAPALTTFPSVAILYTTCNDFVEESVLSCVHQGYSNYRVYILDDSSDAGYRHRIDAFAAGFPELVQVIRRPDRKAFKAGNMNHALSRAAITEPYFAIADADEILPTDFLSKLVPIMEADPSCGFVQANHRANPNSPSALAKALGPGIDIHWKWYQPLRNAFGFVMFLGHGALLRRRCWEEVGGFPDIVSEDLGFAIAIREKGYRGRFVEEVVCYEDFPDTVRAFRIRHIKWTRGTSEFLTQKMGGLLRSKNITWTEKADILFPTLNLPLTLLYFLFMVNANLVMPGFWAHWTEVTWVVGGHEWAMPVLRLDEGFSAIHHADFFFITMLTFFSPVLCFILDMWRKPLQMLRFLAHSTALYAALSPLSSIGVITYAISGKAVFLVTGDTRQEDGNPTSAKHGWYRRWKEGLHKFLHKSHPDQAAVQWLEILTGIGFGIVCVYMFQISFLGLCLAFIFLPLMHRLGWEHRFSRVFVFVPFGLIMLGIALAGLSMAGMQSVFFGYGFHF
ncbi:MAG: glycosyltransferase [Saprospiraceae bacterium]|nr:glycosyltransferase [Saprospiraceae bacterium]